MHNVAGTSASQLFRPCLIRLGDATGVSGNRSPTNPLLGCHFFTEDGRSRRRAGRRGGEQAARPAHLVPLLLLLLLLLLMAARNLRWDGCSGAD